MHTAGQCTECPMQKCQSPGESTDSTRSFWLNQLYSVTNQPAIPPWLFCMPIVKMETKKIVQHGAAVYILEYNVVKKRTLYDLALFSVDEVGRSG